MENDLSIEREVLDWLANGVYASALRLAIKTQDGSLNLIKSEIFALRDNIMNAETEEELAVIEKKLNEYNASLSRYNTAKDSK